MAPNLQLLPGLLNRLLKLISLRESQSYKNKYYKDDMTQTIQNHFVRIYQNAVSDELCDNFIKIFDSAGPHKIDINETYLKCSKLEIPNSHMMNETEPLYQQFHEILKNLVTNYKNDIGTDVGGSTLNFCGLIEKPNIYCYRADGQAKQFFHDHADCWNFDAATRQVSIIAYLNDVDVGGELVFPYYSIRIKPKRGSILMYPSFYTHTNHIEPPVSNNEYFVATWLHFTGATHYLTYNL